MSFLDDLGKALEKDARVQGVEEIASSAVKGNVAGVAEGGLKLSFGNVKDTVQDLSHLTDSPDEQLRVKLDQARAHGNYAEVKKLVLANARDRRHAEAVITDYERRHAPPQASQKGTLAGLGHPGEGTPGGLGGPPARPGLVRRLLEALGLVRPLAGARGVP